MTTAKKANLAWLVQVEKNFDTLHIRAHVVEPQTNGELHLPDEGMGIYWEPTGPIYRDFTISAYLGEIDYRRGIGTRSGGKLWGFTYAYRNVHHIESVNHARRMAAMLSRVEKGLAKATSEAGYVAEGDYLTYLTRIGRALGITRYYVRSHKRQRDMTGETYRSVTVETLQWWVAECSRLAEESPADLIPLS